jgi:histidinol dehydrogenase
MKLRRITAGAPDFEAALTALTRFEAVGDPALEAEVRAIVAEVRARGDAALLEYTRRFDGVAADSVAALEVPRAELRAALAAVPGEQAEALREAAARVRRYHERQAAQSWRYEEADGTLLGQQVSALERVGMYVPGGKAAYPSSVLMNAIPAKVAGVKELVMASPAPRGERNLLVLAAAELAGVDRVIAIGGAQAIAALAYGTESVPRVHKIVGPGNAYVAAAKRLVFGQVGIDMLAGPSEILVLCDGRTDPDWVAMDLFSQAEHDELAQAILVSPDAAFLDAVERSIARLLPQMPRREVIEASLGGRGALVQTRDLDEACAVANRIAPEHLELSVEDPQALLPKLEHAGAIFLGRYSSEAVGDYCAGPNHVLPTSGTARFSSPLGVYDFQKRTSLIGVSRTGAARLGRIAATLARGEGLPAHARAAAMRIENQGQTTISAETESPSGAARRNRGLSPDSLVRPEILALKAYHVPEAGGMVKLDAMENPYRLPEPLAKELAERLARVEINRYPNPAAPRLRACLAEAMRVPAGYDIVLGNGSDDLIQIVTLTLARPGAAMLYPEPTFVMYRANATLSGMKAIGVPLRDDFSFDREAVLAALRAHRPVLVFIAFPNNPTGTLYDEEDVAAVIRAAEGLVVLDEAYHVYARRSFLTRLAEFPNLAVMRTVSKMSLAGIRLGYLVARPQWAAQFDKVRQVYNVNVLTQAAAEFALEHLDVLEEQAARVLAERPAVGAALAALPGVTVFPSQANFFLVRVPDADRVFEALRRQGVLVRNFHGSHPLLANCLRITVGTAEENRILLTALREAL